MNYALKPECLASDRLLVRGVMVKGRALEGDSYGAVFQRLHPGTRRRGPGVLVGELRFMNNPLVKELRLLEFELMGGTRARPWRPRVVVDMTSEDWTSKARERVERGLGEGLAASKVGWRKASSARGWCFLLATPAREPDAVYRVEHPAWLSVRAAVLPGWIA